MKVKERFYLFYMLLREWFRAAAEYLQNFHMLLQRYMNTVLYGVLRERFFYHLKFRRCGRLKML
jgi:hypothetical protein